MDDDTPAELAQLCESLTGVIDPLRALHEDAQGGDGPDASLLAARLANVTRGLASIQKCLADIRRLLVESQSRAEGEGDGVGGDGSTGDDADGVMRDPMFRADLEMCATGTRAVVQRLRVGVMVSRSRSRSRSRSKEVVVDESDWESLSLAETVSINEKTTTRGRVSGPERFEAVEAVVGPLSDASEALRSAFTYRLSPRRWERESSRDPTDQRTRKALRGPEQQLLHFTSEDGGKRRKPWSLTSLLWKPRQLAEGEGNDRSNSRLPLDPSGSPLSRAKTWPVLPKNPADLTVDEARKRSAQIDKQIEADSFAKRNRCSVVLLEGTYQSRVLLTELFAASSKPDAEQHEKLDLRSAVNPARENILRDARRMLREVNSDRLDLGEKPSILEEDLWERLQTDGAVLDEEVARSMQELWSSEDFRNACRRAQRLVAYDELILDAVVRASAKDYSPTPADYRRFIKDRQYQLNDNTFHFDFDPVSVNVLDPSGVLRCCSKPRRMRQDFFADATSFILPVDLVHINQDYKFVDAAFPGPRFESFVRSSLKNLSGGIKKGIWGAFHTSIIIIFFNIDGFRERLRQRPFSERYPDYTGENSLKPAVNYMINRVLSECNGVVRVYPHVGELSDVATLKFILAAVKESMLQRALRASGLF